MAPMGTAFTTHPCGIPDCHTSVSETKLMCAYHWSKVPQGLGRELTMSWLSWRKNGTTRLWDEYVQLRELAIEGVEKWLDEQRSKP